MDKKTNKIVNKVVKEEIAKKLKELREDDYEDIPDEYKEFDPEEFEGSAKQAAKQDIEGSGEEFQDIGQSKYEKNVSAEDFLKDLKQANMRLPQDEKEIEKIQKALDKRKEQVASMKGASLNEKKE